MGRVVTDSELRDLAWRELAQTTVGWDKVKGYPPAKLAGTHWGRAKGYLDMIGRNVVAPAAAVITAIVAALFYGRSTFGSGLYGS